MIWTPHTTSTRVLLCTSTRRISLARSFINCWVLMVSGISTSWSANAWERRSEKLNYKSKQLLITGQFENDLHSKMCREWAEIEVVDGFTPDLFAGPGAESIVQCLCSVDQVSGRMPAVLPQTCQIEHHWFGNITQESFLLVKKPKEIQVLESMNWTHVRLETLPLNVSRRCLPTYQHTVSKLGNLNRSAVLNLFSIS